MRSSTLKVYTILMLSPTHRGPAGGYSRWLLSSLMWIQKLLIISFSLLKCSRWNHSCFRPAISPRSPCSSQWTMVPETINLSAGSSWLLGWLPGLDFLPFPLLGWHPHLLGLRIFSWPQTGVYWICLQLQERFHCQDWAQTLDRTKGQANAPHMWSTKGWVAGMCPQFLRYSQQSTA